MEFDTNNMYTQQNPNWVIMTKTLTVVLNKYTGRYTEYLFIEY